MLNNRVHTRRTLAALTAPPTARHSLQFGGAVVHVTTGEATAMESGTAPIAVSEGSGGLQRSRRRRRRTDELSRDTADHIAPHEEEL